MTLSLLDQENSSLIDLQGYSKIFLDCTGMTVYVRLFVCAWVCLCVCGVCMFVCEVGLDVFV